jgi:hypothetical protein
MPLFDAQDVRKGSSESGFGPSHRGVEIVFQPGLLSMEGTSYRLRGPLTTEQQINTAVRELIDELTTAAAKAKEILEQRRKG